MPTERQKLVPHIGAYTLFWQDIQRTIKEYGMPNNLYSVVKLLLLFPGVHFVFAVRTFQAAGRIPVVGSVLRMVLWTTTCHLFGSEISIDAKIEGGMFIPHPYGIVIAAATIGKNATILQNVTIGMTAKSLGCATIGDNCQIGAGAKVLGLLKIGSDVTIGANAVLLIDVPDGAVAMGVPARVFDRRSID